MRKTRISLKNLICALFISFQSMISSGHPLAAQEFIIVDNPVYNPGMFCVLNIVVALLHKYEQHENAGLQIDFEKNGLYYDPGKGNNWWEYYFEPLRVGNKSQASIQHFAARNCDLDHFTQSCLRRKRVNQLIRRYITLKPDVQSAIDQFISTKVKPKHHLIGIHYRGTDHYIEAPRVSYEAVTQALKKQIHKLHSKKYQIFVATDEQEFLSYICSLYPNRVIFQEIPRSSGTTGLHFQSVQSPFECGHGALIDCILLAKCDLLIRTDSRLSLWSTYFNSSLPVILLNHNYYLDPGVIIREGKHCPEPNNL